MSDLVGDDKTIAVVVTDKTVAIRPISIASREHEGSNPPPQDETLLDASQADAALSNAALSSAALSDASLLERTVVTHGALVTHSTNPPSLLASEIGVGSTLKSRFYLESVLGIGGMGTVYKAKDLRQEEVGEKNPWLAIKILNQNISQHAFSWGALQRECKKTQQLSHPHIVSVFDFDKDGDTLFMSMELLDGVSLDEVLNEPSFDGWPIETLDRMVSQVGDALSYAHSKGIIHSDLKPSNIFMTKNGDFKVYDFGIARAVHDVSSGDAKKKEEPLVALTPAYASVGMLLEEKATPADDLYAFGCVVYMAATAEHPYQRKSALIVLQENVKLDPPSRLTKRKSRVLCRVLDVVSAEILSVDDFKRAFLRENSFPAVVPFFVLFVVVLLMGLLGLYVSGYSDRDILRNLQSGDSINISDGMAEIQKMDVENRYRFLEQSRSELIGFYQQRANQLIQKKRYLAASNILIEARNFYPDSIALSSRAEDLEKEQKQVYQTLKLKGESLLFLSIIVIEDLTAELPGLMTALHHVKGGDELLNEWRLDEWLAQKISESMYLGGSDQVNGLLNLADRLYPDDNRFVKHNDKNRNMQDTFDTSERVDADELTEISNKRIAQQKTLWESHDSVKEVAGLVDWTPRQIKQYLEQTEQGNTEWGRALVVGIDQFVHSNYLKYKERSGNANKQTAKKYKQLGNVLYPDTTLFQTKKRLADPCKSWWAGKGRGRSYQCRDLITSKLTGPTLVVIPKADRAKITSNSHASRLFAITATEISIGEYNTYCRLYKRCRLKGGDKTNPVTNVSLQQAKSYARWLSQMTGFTYRLPRLSEWQYAVGAKNQQQLNDHNCLLTQGTKVIRGNELRSVNKGTANAWGIKNGFGNVQEWVISDSAGIKAAGIKAGGSAETPLSSCNVNYTISAKEKNDQLTGMRLIREL